MPDLKEVRHDEAGRRFTVEGDAGTALMTYRRDGNAIVFLHTEVPREMEGHGVGASLVRAGLDYAKGMGLRIVPRCPFVAAWMARHPDYT